MGQEIERKYLVDRSLWEDQEKPEGVYYRQGYILTDPEKTIRVRLAGDRGYLTIKGRTVGATRLEYEYEIPGQELLDNFAVGELAKVRYTLDVKGKTWEVDAFLGENTGLLVAEIELEHEDESFELPEWIDEEVTGDERYYNARLTEHPYKSW